MTPTEYAQHLATQGPPLTVEQAEAAAMVLVTVEVATDVDLRQPVRPLDLVRHAPRPQPPDEAVRRDQGGVCGTADANPVVILTERDDRPAEDQRSVALASDGHYLPTVDRAMRCLEAVRAGLLEAGRVDY